jgi:hypothetical protein
MVIINYFPAPSTVHNSLNYFNFPILKNIINYFPGPSGALLHEKWSPCDPVQIPNQQKKDHRTNNQSHHIPPTHRKERKKTHREEQHQQQNEQSNDEPIERDSNHSFSCSLEVM